MKGKVPEVPGRSWSGIDKIANRVLSQVYPELLYKPSAFPVIDFIEFELTGLCGYKLCVEELPPLIEAQTDFISKEIILSQDTYEKLHYNDVRARFTAVHEVGHVFLHSAHFEEIIIQKRTAIRLSRSAIPPFKDPECQANVFAASILMPTKHVVNVVQQGNGPMELCNVFDVSWEAATHRINGLDKFL